MQKVVEDLNQKRLNDKDMMDLIDHRQGILYDRLRGRSDLRPYT